MLTQLFGAARAERGVRQHRAGAQQRSRPSPGSPERCRAWPASTRPGPPARFRPARPGGRPRPPSSPNAPACPRGPAPKPTTPWPSCSENWAASTPQSSPTSRPGGFGRRLAHRGRRASGRHPAAGSNRRTTRAAARRPAITIRIRRGRRGRKPREGPGAPGRPAVDARSRPGARRALPTRALALLGPVGKPRGRAGTGCGRGPAGPRCGLRRAQPLPGPAGGPGRPPCPGPGRVHEDRAGPRPGRAAAPVPAGRTTGELDRGGAGQAVAGPQRQGHTGSGAPCAGPTRPFAPNAPRPDWPRTRLTRTGPPWPPRPGSGAAATGKRPATPTAQTRPPGARPLRQAANRRSRLSGRNPRPLGQQLNGEGPRGSAPGPTGQAATARAPAQVFSMTTSTRRFAAEAPEPTTSLAP